MRIPASSLTTVLLAVAALALIGAKSQASPVVDPIAVYGEEIAFDVYREGTRVGDHTVSFRRDNGDIVAETNFNVDIKVLGFTVYTYAYKSTGRWRDGVLQSLFAHTDDNGEISDVQVTHNADGLLVKGSAGTSRTHEDLYPTTHWNSGVIGATRVINTITGAIADVTMLDKGIERVPTGDTTREARHFAYQGDLSTEVWYDARGQWVKMRFPGKDGTIIEYRCRICGSAPSLHGEKRLDGDDLAARSVDIE